MSTFTQAAVTITGSATDALSGTALVTCGGVTATLSASAFSCNVTLNVGLNLIVVKATDVAGNVSASKLHLGLIGTLPAPNTLTVTPSGVNMLVGNMQQFNAIDEVGRVRTDATWTVSDTTVATITTDSSPLMTAVAAGQVTLTATVGSVTGQTIVNVLSGTSLPAGTLLWSAPPPAGFTVNQILQAEPSTGTPDIYTVATESGNCVVAGLSGGGQSLWTTPLAASSCKGTPDGSGGLVVDEGSQILDLDGQTGTPVWTTSALADPFGRQLTGLTVGQDGTVYYTGWFNTSTYGIVSLAADTGVAKLVYSPPEGVYQITGCNGTVSTYGGGAATTPPVIGPDGSLFAAIYVGNIYEAPSDCQEGTYSTSYNQTLSLLQIPPGGAATLTGFKVDNTVPTWEFPNYQLLGVIPDGQGGALVSWNVSQSGATYQGNVTDVIGSGSANVSLPGQTESIEMVLGQNGTAFANTGTAATAFNLSGMAPLWTYTTQSPNGMSVVAATGDGGLIVNDSSQGLISVNVNGAPGSATPAPADAAPWTSGNWIGDFNDTLPGMAGGPLASIAMNSWPVLNGSRKGTHSSPKLTIATFIAVAPSTVYPFDNTLDTENEMKGAISAKAASQRYYINPLDGTPTASTTNFFLENGNPADVIGFIGHSLVAGSNDPLDPIGNISIGLGFTDFYLVRGPDCSLAGHAAYHCYWNETEVIATPINAATAVQVQGGWVQVQAPCAPGAIPVIGSDGNAWCIRVPPPPPLVTLSPGVITSARVVFTAACDTTDWYSTWWIWNLFQSQIPPSGALVMPDIATMMTLPVNTSQGFAPSAYGDVDLAQGVIAYQTFINSLALGEDVDTAVQNVNTELAINYPQMTVPPDLQKLPQLVFMMVAGGTDVCPVCVR